MSAPIATYASAVRDCQDDRLQVQWQPGSRASIQAKLRADEVVSVQMNYVEGWRLDGLPGITPTADGAGLIAIDPKCRETCTLNLTLYWDGQRWTWWSQTVGAVSLAAWVLALIRACWKLKPFA